MRIFKAFALTGRRAKCCLYPGCCPGLGASALSGRVGQWLLLFASFCFWGVWILLLHLLRSAFGGQ